MTPPGFILRADRALGLALRAIALASFLLLTVLIAANVVARFTSLFSITWFDEMVAALFAYMVFFGAAALWREREHFAIDMLPVLLAGTVWSALLGLLLATLGLIFALTLTYYGAIFVARTTALTPILEVPQAWSYACVPAAAAIMTLYAVRDVGAAVAALTGALRPRRREQSPA